MKGARMPDGSREQVTPAGEPTDEQINWTAARWSCPSRKNHEPGKICGSCGTDWDGLEK